MAEQLKWIQLWVAGSTIARGSPQNTRISRGLSHEISSIQTNYVARVILQNWPFAAPQSRCEIALFCPIESYLSGKWGAKWQARLFVADGQATTDLISRGIFSTKKTAGSLFYTATYKVYLTNIWSNNFIEKNPYIFPGFLYREIIEKISSMLFHEI